MTETIVIVHCDSVDCDASLRGIGPNDVRAKRVAAGWKHIHGDRDYCPLHAVIEIVADAVPIEHKGHRIYKTTTKNRWQEGNMVRIEGPLYDRPVHCANVRNAKLRIDQDRNRKNVGLPPTDRRYGGAW